MHVALQQVLDDLSITPERIPEAPQDHFEAISQLVMECTEVPLGHILKFAMSHSTFKLVALKRIVANLL